MPLRPRAQPSRHVLLSAAHELLILRQREHPLRRSCRFLDGVTSTQRDRSRDQTCTTSESATCRPHRDRTCRSRPNKEPYRAAQKARGRETVRRRLACCPPRLTSLSLRCVSASSQYLFVRNQVARSLDVIAFKERASGVRIPSGLQV